MHIHQNISPKAGFLFGCVINALNININTFFRCITVVISAHFYMNRKRRNAPPITKNHQNAMQTVAVAVGASTITVAVATGVYFAWVRGSGGGGAEMQSKPTYAFISPSVESPADVESKRKTAAYEQNKASLKVLFNETIKNELNVPFYIIEYPKRFVDTLQTFLTSDEVPAEIKNNIIESDCSGTSAACVLAFKKWFETRYKQYRNHFGIMGDYKYWLWKNALGI